MRKIMGVLLAAVVLGLVTSSAFAATNGHRHHRQHHHHKQHLHRT